MSDPWGSAQPPAPGLEPLPPLPPRLARLAQVASSGVPLDAEDPYDSEFPRADELPEVQALAERGWRPLNDAPLYCLLPAAWPAEHRTWVPDRRPSVSRIATTADYFGRVTPPPTDPEWAADDFVPGAAAAAGLPPPPTGRLWLLRSPWPRIPVEAIYDLVWAGVERREHVDEVRSMYEVAEDVLAWEEDRAYAALPAEARDLLLAWADAGRIGATAGSVYARRLFPSDLARLVSEIGPDETTALAWFDGLHGDVGGVLDVDSVIRFVGAWRAAGLPPGPPPGAHRFIGRSPAELRDWLDAGFDMYAAAQLDRAGLERAQQWRAAGFSAADTYELLRDDPELSTDQALAFDRVGIPRTDRRVWVYEGFSADDAAAWAAAGLTPAYARVWRARGTRAADVEPGQRLPTDLTGVRGLSQKQRPEGVIDPPGTRGRGPRRRSGDTDPWINDD